jgi:hypothetical protein
MEFGRGADECRMGFVWGMEPLEVSRTTAGPWSLGGSWLVGRESSVCAYCCDESLERPELKVAFCRLCESFRSLPILSDLQAQLPG